MIAAARLRDAATGFSRTFWVANTLELFERFAFYGSKAVLTIYLAERVGLGPQAAGSLAGLFSGVLYCLPILAGTVVDRYGFKKSLAACFSIFCVGYFLIGLAGLSFGQGIVAAIGRGPYITAVLLLTAVVSRYPRPSAPAPSPKECRTARMALSMMRRLSTFTSYDDSARR